MNTLHDPAEDPLASSGAGRVGSSYPLAPTQRGILFQSLHGEKAGLYHVQVILEITQDLDIDAFRKSWAKVAERYAALRTSFREAAGDEPTQVVWKSIDVPFEYEDWRTSGEEQRSFKRETRLRWDHEQGFSESEAPLWRLHLARLEEERYELLWSRHYALMDGPSQTRVLREVERLYGYLVEAQTIDEVPETPFQHYVDWWNRQDFTRDEAFWSEELQSVPPASPLPGYVKNGTHKQPMLFLSG